MRDRLYAGTARADITPQLGHNLAGWILRRPAAHKITPILARALVLASGEAQVAIVACDLLWMPEPLSSQVRGAVSARCGIPPGQIFLMPSHNHFGPDVEPFTAEERAYVEALPDHIACAVRQALDGLQPARWGLGYGREETIAINSRFRLKDGTIAWIAPQPEQVASTTGPLDPAVGVLLISDEGGRPLATLYNYACHANCGEEAGISAMSWDWVGYASQAIENAVGGEAFFLPGACGNVHPARYGVAPAMGEKLAREVITVARQIQTRDQASLAIQQWPLTLPARDFEAFDPQQIRVICRQIEDAEVRSAVEAVFFEQLRRLRAEKRASLSASMGLIRMDGLAILCVPGELFVELGLEIKQASPFEHTLVVELVNDAIGYIPTRRAYEEGGYQTTTVAPLAPGAGELLVAEALARLRDLMHSA